MIENLENYLIGIALGVRFRANFSIEDQFGKIADTILYSDGAFFGPEVFPKATSSAAARILFNEVTNDRIHIDNSNVILEINFGEDAKFNRNNLETILDYFDKQIIGGILKEFSIKEIKRIGYIRRYLFEMEDLATSFVNKTIGSTLGGVNDINLKFSKKFPVQEALVKKDVNDFDNAIFTVIKKADLNEIFMAVDYQSFYDPYLPSSEQIKFQPFIKKANGFNSKNYQIWLNDNYMEQKNE